MAENCFSQKDVGAVVIGGDYQGLGIVRSLGRHQVPVCVIDDEHSIARYSNYATHFVSVSDLRDERQAVNALIQSVGLFEYFVREVS